MQEMKRRVSIVLWCVSAFLMTGLGGQSPPAQQVELAAPEAPDKEAMAADDSEPAQAASLSIAPCSLLSILCSAMTDANMLRTKVRS